MSDANLFAIEQYTNRFQSGHSTELVAFHLIDH